MSSRPEKKAPFGQNVYKAFFGDLPADRINWPAARFADRALEREYQHYILANELPKDRLVNFVGITIYVIFGLLDLMTFTAHLTEVLTLRLLICAPAAYALAFLTYLRPVKPYFQYATVGIMLIAAFSIVAMIGILPASGGPPYIVGILTVFIFYSCIQRIYFPLAATSYLAVFATYTLTVTVLSPKVGSEIASGHFFMTLTTVIALSTGFVQEVRSRIDFYRRRQREMDAAYIEKLLIEATAADRAKISFLSILSHELRTPLHQIVGFSEVVKNQHANNPKADPAAYLDEIHTSATGLLASIGKMLRYADATAGKISYDMANCSVKYLLETVVDQARSSADAAKVSLRVGDVENATLYIDHLHTAYAVGQLLDNAIAASKPESSIEFRGEPDGDGGYVLEITDHGCGMSEEQIRAAFTPFMQTEDVRTRSMDGVGLGLSLSKKILEDQHAELILESEVGAGTTAIVRFPLNQESARAA